MFIKPRSFAFKSLHIHYSSVFIPFDAVYSLNGTNRNIILQGQVLYNDKGVDIEIFIRIQYTLGTVI